ELRCRHHHRAADGPHVQPGGQARYPLCAVQGHAGDRQRATGSVDMIYAANLIVAPLIAAGKLRPLAKLDRDAPPSMADIPTLADAAGLPALEDISIWLGLVAPRGTPKPIVDKINAEVVKALTDPAVRERSERTGNYPVTVTPEQFAALIRKE